MKNKGFSIAEMAIAIAILSTVVLMSRVAILLIDNLLQSSAVAKVQQESQLVLYTITRDVRNASKIVSASSTTLVLNTLDTSLGYDLVNNPNLFDSVRMSTITYMYTVAGSETYLRRTYERMGVVMQDKQLLKNLLLTPSNANYIFNPCKNMDSSQAECPLPGTPGAPLSPNENLAVDIRFRMSPLFVKNSEVVYSAKEMLRSQGQ